MSIFNKNSGYTLAEIMVTLALVGFLATVTLSTVGSSIQQRTRLAQFRTAHARMTAAFKNVSVDKARIYNCYLAPTTNEIREYGLHIEGTATPSNNSGCGDMVSSFVRAMGATRFCENNPYGEGCIPNNYPTAKSGCFTNYLTSTAYVLDNSMIILLNKKETGLKLFAVDVNGRKGPNKWGLDIFPFSVKATETKEINNTVFVKALGILSPPDSCDYGVDTAKSTEDRADRTTEEMMKESAGISLKRIERNGGKL